MAVFSGYAQPKGLFIHSFHRLIHSFPQEKQRNFGVFHAVHRFIHILYPQWFYMWIIMWTCSISNFWLFTIVTILNIYTRSCMFARNVLLHPAEKRAGYHIPESFESNENVKSPKKSAKAAKKSRTISVRL